MKINYTKDTICAGDIIDYCGMVCMVVRPRREETIGLVDLKNSDTLEDEWNSLQELNEDDGVNALLIRHSDIVISDARAGE